MQTKIIYSTSLLFLLLSFYNYDTSTLFVLEMGKVVFSLLESMVSTIFSILTYLLIFLIVLIPQMIILGVLAYKTKPEEQSFKTYYDNLLKIIQIENSNNTPPSEIKAQGYFDSLKNKFTFKLQIFILKKITEQNLYQYDFSFFRLAFICQDKKRHIFIGIFGSWYPLFIQ